jgi:hypothetical protein
MQLEDEQHELLAKFVEAHRSTPQERRGAFIASQIHNQPQATFLHSRVHGLSFQGSMSDAEILADAGFLRMSYGSGDNVTISVLPQGIEVYQKKKGSSPPLDTMSADFHKFIFSVEFRTIHPAAFAKWERAAELLWAADSAQHLTTIGHLCREALQEFAASLAREHRVDVSTIEPAKTVARLQKIVADLPTGGTTKRAFLSALLAYWGTVSDLVQRQEHGAQREGAPLVWEDARCVVFQTCIVMFEISRGVR